MKQAIHLSCKRLLQVSDYITLFGGIEMFIHNIGVHLEGYGVQTKYMGLTLPLQWLKKLKVFFLPFAGFNIFSAMHILFLSIAFRPDTIWFHGVSRFHGWLAIYCSRLFSRRAKILMMYHDLGYFHPFPSLIMDEKQVLPWSYANWKLMARQGSMRFPMYMVKLKYLSASLLRRSLLKSVDVHLVPSEFMVQYLVDWGVKKSSIRVLPHFIVDYTCK